MEKIRAFNIYEKWHIMLIELSARDVEMIAMCTDVSAASWYDVINYPLPVVTPLARWTKFVTAIERQPHAKWDFGRIYGNFSAEYQGKARRIDLIFYEAYQLDFE